MSSTEDSNGSQRSTDRYASREQLRALAHPLRLDLMDHIGRRGTARAADLAADLGIPANSVSYHLRILARGGVIVDAPEAARDRRDRVWKLGQGTFGDISAGSVNDPRERDPEYRTASGAMSIAVLDWMRSAWAAEIARSTAAGTEPEEGLGQLVATTMRLSTQQAQEMNRRIGEIISEYNRLNRDEDLAFAPEDPDLPQKAHALRVLWAVVGEQGLEPDGAEGAAVSAREQS